MVHVAVSKVWGPLLEKEPYYFEVHVKARDFGKLLYTMLGSCSDMVYGPVLGVHLVLKEGSL